MVHIEDICGAFLAMLTAPREKVHNQSFNVGRTEENYRVSQLAEIVQQTVPNCKIEYVPGGGPDKRCYRVDCGKIAREVPGFKPQWTVKRGAKQLYDAFRSVPLTEADVASGRYLRLATLQKLMQAGTIDSELRTMVSSS